METDIKLVVSGEGIILLSQFTGSVNKIGKREINPQNIFF